LPSSRYGKHHRSSGCWFLTRDKWCAMLLVHTLHLAYERTTEDLMSFGLFVFVNALYALLMFVLMPFNALLMLVLMP
jgi:hypothetical protein